MPRSRSQNEETTSDEENTGLMQASGLTEEDRRQIRKDQRQLLRELEEKDSLEVEEARDRNNTIYKRVRYTREAVLDGENLIQIAKKASQKVDRLIQAPRYDADRLVRKLKEKVRQESSQGGQFDWEMLGDAAGACFNALPSNICYLNGPIQKDAPPPQRRAPQRRQRIEERDVEEEKPEDVQGHTEKDDNKLSAIEKSMQDMAKVLKKKVDDRYREKKRNLEEAYDDPKNIPKPTLKALKKQGVEICAHKFLFNPQSFTQTVENIFHFSFLVKKGNAAINIREGLNMEGLSTEPGLKIKYTKENVDKHTVAKQSIMSLTMQDWRDLCEAYEVEEGDLPHRKIHKEAYANSLSQASGIPSSP